MINNPQETSRKPQKPQKQGKKKKSADNSRTHKQNNKQPNKQRNKHNNRQPTAPDSAPAISPQEYETRLQKLQNKLQGPLLVGDLANVRYLTGFTGSHGYLLADADKLLFITDGRYQEQAAKEIPGICEPLILRESLGRELARRGWYLRAQKQAPSQASKKAPKKASKQALGLEKKHFTLANLEDFQEAGLRVRAADSPVYGLRQIKSKSEIAITEEALRLTEEAMVYISSVLKPGMQEREVAAHLEHYCRLKGAEEGAFDFIVASGPRSSLPHGIASSREIGPEELIQFDFGIRWKGYCSDFSRVVYTGSRLPRRLKTMWERVNEARQLGMESIRAGVPAAQPDKAVRDYFRKKRVLKKYAHSLGHGVGLDIHESPRLSRLVDSVLENGMLVTVEPGLYYPDFAGIRIEDMVVVRSRGVQQLTDFPSAIACLG